MAIAINRKKALLRLSVLAKDLNKIDEQQAKRSAISYTNATPRRWGNIQAEADWAGMERYKKEHEIHCICVALGFAQKHDAEYYEDIIMRPSSFHGYKHIRGYESVLRLSGIIEVEESTLNCCKEAAE